MRKKSHLRLGNTRAQTFRLAHKTGKAQGGRSL